MGQDGIPISFAIIISVTILGAMFLIGLIIAAMFFGMSIP